LLDLLSLDYLKEFGVEHWLTYDVSIVSLGKSGEFRSLTKS